MVCRDPPGGRTLSSAETTDTTGMTVESCIAFCSNGGFVYAGIEYAQECCMMHLSSGSNKVCSSICSQTAATQSVMAVPKLPLRTATWPVLAMLTRYVVPVVSTVLPLSRRRTLDGFFHPVSPIEPVLEWRPTPFRSEQPCNGRFMDVIGLLQVSSANLCSGIVHLTPRNPATLSPLVPYQTV